MRQQTAYDVGRPPSDRPKDSILHLRVHPELRAAIEGYARVEHRTIATMTDLLLREAVIARRKAAGESAKDIEGLP